MPTKKELLATMEAQNDWVEGWRLTVLKLQEENEELKREVEDHKRTIRPEDYNKLKEENEELKMEMFRLISHQKDYPDD